MALAEFQNPNIQLLIKDDGGTPAGRAAGAPSRRSRKAPRSSSGRCSRRRSRRRRSWRARAASPVIAFSTDSSVAGRGVYLLSFLPESDVDRHRRLRRRHRQAIFRRAAARQRLWQRGRGRVQAGGRRAGGGAHRRVRDDTAPTARTRRRAHVAQALGAGRCAVHRRRRRLRSCASADALTAAGANLQNIQLLGTGLWDNPRVFASPALQGGLVSPRRIQPASAVSPAAIAPRLRRRPGAHRDAWPMTRSRWSRRWRERQGAQRFAPDDADQSVAALPASTACSASAPTAPTSAGLPVMRSARPAARRCRSPARRRAFASARLAEASRRRDRRPAASSTRKVRPLLRGPHAVRRRCDA